METLFLRLREANKTVCRRVDTQPRKLIAAKLGFITGNWIGCVQIDLKSYA